MEAIDKINIGLAILAVVLALNLVNSSMVGYVTYTLDLSEPQCSFYNEGDIREIPVNLCCPELQKMLSCDLSDDKSYYKCYIKENYPRFYVVNHKAMSFCLKEGYYVQNR
jgi:hypothetical protein